MAQAVLSAMVGAGLHRAWNHPQRVPLPTRYGGGGVWGGPEGGGGGECEGPGGSGWVSGGGFWGVLGVWRGN